MIEDLPFVPLKGSSSNNIRKKIFSKYIIFAKIINYIDLESYLII